MANLPWLAYVALGEGLLGVALGAILVWRGKGRLGTLLLSAYLA